MTLKGQIKVIETLMACILEIVHSKHIVTSNHVYEVICGGSNGAIGFDPG